jgi:hypothetical protein
LVGARIARPQQTPVDAQTKTPYNPAPHSLKNSAKPFFEIKGFGDGGVGEGPFIKRAFPHKKKKIYETIQKQIFYHSLMRGGGAMRCAVNVCNPWVSRAIAKHRGNADNAVSLVRYGGWKCV